MAAKSELMSAESVEAVELVTGAGGFGAASTEVFPVASVVLNLASIMSLLAEVPTHLQEISSPAAPLSSMVNSCSLFLVLSLVLALVHWTFGLAAAVSLPALVVAVELAAAAEAEAEPEAA